MNLIWRCRLQPTIVLADVAGYVRQARASRIDVIDIEVAMDWKPYITADPEIMHGAVCFRGTRIPVSVVLDNLAAGESAATILDEYPTLKPEHIPAAIGYAAELARERIVPVPA